MIRALYGVPGEAVRPLESRDEMARLLKEGKGTIWIDIASPAPEEKDLLGAVCGFHPLAVELCEHRSKHSRMSDFGPYLYMVVHAVRSVLPLKSDELDLFLGPHFLVTYRTADISALEEVWKRVREIRSVSERGADHILAEILDGVADGHIEQVDRLDQALDGIEDKLFKHAGKPALREIFHLKKDILQFRRLVGPQREVFHRLSRGEFPSISKEDAMLFRDVYDRAYRVSEMLESFRDVLAGALEVYLTIVANRTNEIMRVLTVFSIILMATSLLAGIYGMNFEGLPFAKSGWGFWAVLAAMGAIAGVLLGVFRKRRWI
jgi:magnesium transporter